MWPEYFATLCAGLESVTAEEVCVRLPGSEITHSEPGKVFFRTPAPPGTTLSLRSVNHVHMLAARFEGIGSARSELERLTSLAAHLDLAAGVAAVAELRPWEADAPSFRVTAYRGGEQEYTSVELAAAIGAGIVSAYGWRVDLENHDVEVVAHLHADRLTVGVRLSLEGSLHRRHRVATGHATLKGSVAFALVWLSLPSPGDVLLDPLCGAATIPIEAALGWPDLVCIGGDLSQRELAAARENLAFTGAAAAVARWDARALPFERESVQRIVSDLPFGRRIGSARANRHLYPAVVREIGRVLAPSGRAVLLTLEKKLLTRLVARDGRLQIVERLPIVLSNLRPSIYILERT